jgi:hypothetical protein
MRGSVVKRLRTDAKKEMAITAMAQNRPIKAGEINRLYVAKKNAYKTIRQDLGQPKFKSTRRQKRLSTIKP